MKYVRLYADELGESHFEDLEFDLISNNFAPPAPSFDISASMPATGVTFARVPVGWVGESHPAPRRQYFLLLAGFLSSETSDGDRRNLDPGSVVLLEDTKGKGHRTWVVGDAEVLAAFVPLAD